MQWRMKISGHFFIGLMILLGLLFTIFLLLTSKVIYSNAFDATGGRLELSEGDLKYNIGLKGEWKFYKDELISMPGESSDYSIRSVPDGWGASGFGTYILEIEGLTPGDCYSLYLPDQSTACRLYINSVPAAEIGTVGTEKSSEKIHWEPRVHSFNAAGEKAVISLQVSSFNSYPGGFIRLMKLGLPENIIREYNRDTAVQMLLFGGLLITGLYSLSLFLLSFTDRPALYFAVLNFTMAARTAFTGQRVINLWLSSPDWQLIYMILFMLGALLLASFILFLDSLFRNLFRKKIIRLTLAFCALLIMVPLFAPPKVLQFFDYAFFSVSIMFFIYAFAVLITGIRKKVRGAHFAFAGIVFIIATIILDMVFPPGSNVIPLGIFIFILFQSLVVGERHSYIEEQNRILHNVAVRDDMTNLYKKDHFRKLISSSIDDSDFPQHHALLFIDMDNFKSINDRFGHDAGDKLIVTVAERLLKSLRYSDIACRFGGDEFTLWLYNTSRKESELVAGRILENIAAPFSIDDSELSVSVSIGMAYYPDDSEDVDALFRKCDERMYQAKELGKNRYCNTDRK